MNRRQFLFSSSALAATALVPVDLRLASNVVQAWDLAGKPDITALAAYVRDGTTGRLHASLAAWESAAAGDQGGIAEIIPAPSAPPLRWPQIDDDGYVQIRPIG
jgi:hypothetical protein